MTSVFSIIFTGVVPISTSASLLLGKSGLEGAASSLLQRQIKPWKYSTFIKKTKNKIGLHDGLEDDGVEKTATVIYMYMSYNRRFTHIRTFHPV